MKEKPVKNVEVSVFNRLKNISSTKQDDFNLLLQRYAAERFLYRLSHSRYADNLILKGGMLILGWRSGESHRVTKDIDFLGTHIPVDRIAPICAEICTTPISIDDGVLFVADTIRSQEIKEDADYHGIRILIDFKLHSARNRLQIDVAFGDIVTPGLETFDYPAMLASMPASRIRTYNPDTVIAEKFQAIVQLGITNTRMKDFYDIWSLSHFQTFKGEHLKGAIQQTFLRRQTALPESAALPMAFREEFFGDPDKIKDWKGFVKNSKAAFGTDLTLGNIITDIQVFLIPILDACHADEPFLLIWNHLEYCWIE